MSGNKFLSNEWVTEWGNKGGWILQFPYLDSPVPLRYLFLLTFYFEMLWDSQKSCKNSRALANFSPSFPSCKHLTCGAIIRLTLHSTNPTALPWGYEEHRSDNLQTVPQFKLDVSSWLVGDDRCGGRIARRWYALLLASYQGVCDVSVFYGCRWPWSIR